MSWRPAKSLDVLLTQVNAAYPGRDKSSDGTIGNEQHQAGHSEHNPNAAGVVRARDITSDPAHGLVARKLAQSLIDSRDPRIAYVISNREICSATISPWKWRPYHGASPHEAHMHLSVAESATLYDDPSPWDIGGPHAPPPAMAKPQSGKGSWYSQYRGKYKWVDTGDAPNSNALGVPDDAQGISFLDRETLGKWFLVTAPNGRTLIEQQTEVGPGQRTGRKIDISAASAERFGYTPKNFPTDGVFKWEPAAAPKEVANLMPKRQAITYRDIRKD